MDQDDDTPVNIRVMADDISHPHAACSAQSADFLLDEDTVAPVDVRFISTRLDSCPLTHVYSARLSAKVY